MARTAGCRPKDDEYWAVTTAAVKAALTGLPADSADVDTDDETFSITITPNNPQAAAVTLGVGADEIVIDIAGTLALVWMPDLTSLQEELEHILSGVFEGRFTQHGRAGSRGRVTTNHRVVKLGLVSGPFERWGVVRTFDPYV